MTISEYMDRKFYPGFTNNWDDILFRERILEVLHFDQTLLDMGAGAGIVSQMNFKGCVKTVVGIDLDERVQENPYLDQGIVGDVTRTPFDSSSFDIIICDNVMEHVAEPDAFFQEINRLLKPNGRFLGKTPNKWHYMPILARFTPYWFHRLFNRLRGRKGEDTFPTVYKLNSPKCIKRQAAATELSLSYVELVEGRPEYLRFNPVTYLFGILYERLVNKFRFLRPLSILMIVCLEKK